MLTPLDIHNKEFRRGFRGYVESEVDEFLDEVVRSFEALLRDNAALKAQAEELRQKVEQYRQMEETLKKALVVAQETADEVRAAARREAELIVREAQAEADRRRQAAEEVVRRARERLQEAERRALEFRARVRSLLEGQIEVLKREENWRLDEEALEAALPSEATLVAPARGASREEAPAAEDGDLVPDGDGTAG